MSRTRSIQQRNASVVKISRTHNASLASLQKPNGVPVFSSKRSGGATLHPIQLPSDLSHYRWQSKMKLKDQQRPIMLCNSKIDRVLEIESATNQKLVGLFKKGPITHELFEIYQGIFSEFIAQNSGNSSILSDIKLVYEEWISMKLNETAEINTELDSCKQAFEEERRTVKALNRRFKKLAMEHIEVNSRFSDQEGVMYELKEQVKSLRGSGKQARLASQATIGYLSREIVELKIKLEETTVSRKALKEREAKLTKFILSLNQEDFSNSALYQEVSMLKQEVASPCSLCSSKNDSLDKLNEVMNSPSSRLDEHSSDIQEFYQMSIDKMSLFDELSPILSISN